MMIAASILLFLVVGGLWYFNHEKVSPLKEHIALNNVPKSEIIKSDRSVIAPIIQKKHLNRDLTVLKPAGNRIGMAGQVSTSNKEANKQIIKNHDAAYENLTDNQISVKSTQDSSLKPNMLAEVIVTNFPPAQKKSEVAGSVTTLSAAPVRRSLENRASGVNITNKYNVDSASHNLITGQIFSKSDGEPLPGVVVGVIGKKDKVLTDAQGIFNIWAGRQDELNITYIGFKSERVKVKNSKNIKVLLAENQNVLSEVVVIPREGQNIEEARPADGWAKFNNYLEKNASSPDGITGIVRLSFIVNPDNRLSSFTIIKSLSNKADEEAIKLIKNGPSWIHNQNGKPETIKAKVRF
ncbi:MAG: hypothetical protein EOP42_27965 [Sphingobacteriaceae bacterium]|nr:MAG: hypothetical protein EOP42_27965 [Sphingobacteriaceae bacterium]